MGLGLWALSGGSAAFVAAVVPYFSYAKGDKVGKARAIWSETSTSAACRLMPEVAILWPRWVV